METLDKIKELCRIKGISLKTLEANLHYGNGSLAKAKSIKSERVQEIANYFGVPVEQLLNDTSALLYKTAETSVKNQKLLKMFEQLDKQDKDKVFMFIEMLLTDSKYKKAIPDSEVG